ncbi:MAG: hypothetical protein L3J35_13285 [Bacteroidales bacterium]|nr:hypothetical protein [Bacteroidales bacterium]
MKSDYSISILKDYSKLEEIHELAHNAFIESGLITKKQNNKLDLFPHLNKSKNTKTIIAEYSDKIIGTNSMTSDGINGLHTDKYFKKETDNFRKNTKIKIGSSWRLATHKDYRSNIMLLLDLIEKSVNVAINMKIETCLYIFAKKHEGFYKKLLNATLVAEKKCYIEKGLEVHLVLMKTETEETRKHLNEIFIRRKF